MLFRSAKVGRDEELVKVVKTISDKMASPPPHKFIAMASDIAKRNDSKNSATVKCTDNSKA